MNDIKHASWNRRAVCGTIGTLDIMIGKGSLEWSWEHHSGTGALDEIAGPAVIMYPLATHHSPKYFIIPKVLKR